MTENKNLIEREIAKLGDLSMDEIIQKLDSILESIEENDKSIEGTREIVFIKTIQEEIFALLQERKGLKIPLTETQKAFCVKILRKNTQEEIYPKEKTHATWDLLMDGLIPTC